MFSFFNFQLRLSMFGIFGFSIFVLSFGAASAAFSVPRNFSPCDHYQGEVSCNQFSLEKVRRAFNQTSYPTLEVVQLTLDIINETFILEDVFGSIGILRLKIGYPIKSYSEDLSPSLQVDANAFRSTKNYTNEFSIYYVDCTLLDLGFLSEFNKLTKFDFSHIDNIQHCLPSLPPLPKLTSLEFSSCTGMDHLNIFPTLTNGLKTIKLFALIYNNDETLDRIVDWLLLSSANALEEIKIQYMEQMTQVPLKISSFKALRVISIEYNNKISTIKSGAFSLSVPVSELSIIGNGITEIETSAFQGDFKDAKVFVNSNKLTRLDESVFGPILQQMTSGNGSIFATGNPIDCSEGSICHLAWLKRYLDCDKFSFDCSYGSSFKKLQPTGFNHCP